jgi:mRNA-degrading endonuclease YafQ of YafQ-DinJ toxin-antitoxin module
MFLANTTPYFLKKAQKIVNKNLTLAKQIDNCIQNLLLNPKNPTLKSHKVVTPKFGTCYSSSVNGDLRIIWDYSDDQLFVLDLLDIGGHSGSGSVY